MGPVPFLSSPLYISSPFSPLSQTLDKHYDRRPVSLSLLLCKATNARRPPLLRHTSDNQLVAKAQSSSSPLPPLPVIRRHRPRSKSLRQTIPVDAATPLPPLRSRPPPNLRRPAADPPRQRVRGLAEAPLSPKRSQVSRPLFSRTVYPPLFRDRGSTSRRPCPMFSFPSTCITPAVLELTQDLRWPLPLRPPFRHRLTPTICHNHRPPPWSPCNKIPRTLTLTLTEFGSQPKTWPTRQPEPDPRFEPNLSQSRHDESGSDPTAIPEPDYLDPNPWIFWKKEIRKKRKNLKKEKKEDRKKVKKMNYQLKNKFIFVIAILLANSHPDLHHNGINKNSSNYCRNCCYCYHYS